MTALARPDVARRIYPPALGVAAQTALLIGLGATAGLSMAGWVVGVAFTIGTCVLLARALQQPDVGRWGAADSITFGRLILTGGVTALVADALTTHVHRPVLSVLAAVSLLLDAADGQVARRTATVSRFGARFDMEADSVLAIALSLYVANLLGWWALTIGLFRYVFALATWAMPWLRAELPPRFSRKVVAASQGVVLVVVSSGLLPQAIGQLSIVASLATLVWSFGVDVWWLRRAARHSKHSAAQPAGDAATHRGLRTAAEAEGASSIAHTRTRCGPTDLAYETALFAEAGRQ